MDENLTLAQWVSKIDKADQLATALSVLRLLQTGWYLVNENQMGSWQGSQSTTEDPGTVFNLFVTTERYAGKTGV